MTVTPGQFWSWLGQRPIGATVVAARGPDGPAGFLGLSASHISADPPLMLVSVARTTGTLGAIEASRSFAISFLPRGCERLVDVFGGKAGISGADRFAPGEWTTLATGSPVHRDAMGAMDCELQQSIDLGATLVLVGRVVAGTARADGEPLILFRGKPYPA